MEQRTHRSLQQSRSLLLGQYLIPERLLLYFVNRISMQLKQVIPLACKLSLHEVMRPDSSFCFWQSWLNAENSYRGLIRSLISTPRSPSCFLRFKREQTPNRIRQGR